MKRGAGRDLLVLLLLFGLGSVLFLTNLWFSVIDDEAYQVGSAAQPFGVVANQFRPSNTQLHPPLPDIILHFWLRRTRNSLLLLRAPSTLFFVLGIWVCSLSAKRKQVNLAKATLILGVLWPYGFYFGRYAVWLSFCFFLLACLLYAYICYNIRQWASSGHPTSSQLLFIATLYGTDFEPTMEASAWLDQRCVRGKTERFVPNPNFNMKTRFFGPSQGSSWRIEIREYNCRK
jgi:hypothetical protein